MIKRILTAAAFLSLSSVSINTVAATETRQQLLEELVQVQGLPTLWKTEITKGENQSDQIAREYIEEAIEHLDTDHEILLQFDQALAEFNLSVKNPWQAKEISQIWNQYYGVHFNDDEIRALISFYKTDIGQKELTAQRNAQKSFSHHFVKAGNPIIKKAMNTLVSEIKTIATECNCIKSNH